MQQITEIITNGAISILVILAGIAVKAVKDYLVQKGGEKTIKIVEILAKNAVINTDNKAVSTISETLHDPDLYANNRINMRKHEQELREMRYKIEDAILAELEADAEHKE
ncbi:prophage protein [Streptococcus pneumoniae]|nr:prophage protein [Streptococcus pneumoniae]